MVKLDTIQKVAKLNDVFAMDEKGSGGAHHFYVITTKDALNPLNRIQFQHGARYSEGSEEGVLEGDLLEIVRHRLECFQAGEFANDYNAHALKHIEEALHCMNARVEDRLKRNVLGKEIK